jgi:pyruvate kinase
VAQNQVIYITNKDRVFETEEGEPIIIQSEPVFNFRNCIKGDVIHANYGEVSFRIDQVEEDYIKCIALNSGSIQRYNSLSVEGKEHFSNDLVVSNKDKLVSEIEAACKLGVEFLVISIIDNPVAEINSVKEIIEKNGNVMSVVVKIDNPKSIQYIDDYIELTDAIYFSRSDLNLKDSLSKICFYQKSIVSKCGYLGIPVIIAGTFLDTMRTLPNPIRAEISDLYNTILQGIDCLLLTAEIISGLYPLEVIETISI